MEQKHIENHYVPKMYLKNWSNDGSTIWMYRRIVSNKNVELWKKQSIEKTASVPNLYSHIKQDEITDEFENWLNAEVESPAKPVIEKVILGEELTKEELLPLLRYTAAQIVRTPAYFINHYEGWKKEIPVVLEATMKETSEKIMEAKRKGKSFTVKNSVKDDLIPIKLSFEPNAVESGTIYLTAETAIGRKIWLSHIRRMVDKNIDILRKHKWTIIEASSNVEWPTSDDPVICLGYRDKNDYDFQGGIAQKNAEIIFPLSPKHLLYTRVGSRSSVEDFQRNEWFSETVKKFIFEHGYLCIYSKNKQKYMFKNCPRSIDSIEYSRIQKMLCEWHNDNMELEMKFE